MSLPLHQRGVAALGRALANGECSSVELTQSLLDRVAAGDRFGAFLATHAASALAQARGADTRRARGEAGPLTGVPVAAGTRSAATAAAEPPDEPPGTRAVSQGLRAGA